jgi:non-ribosomal peptide synthetase component F
VVIEHRALANYICWARGTYVREGPIAFPLFSPLTFDLTITSVFVPLTSGGTIVVYPETGERADLALIDVARDDLVDIIKLTPSHVRLLEQHDLAGSRVRQLILGGEGLTTDIVRRIARIFGDDVVVHNEYGPTEATVGCVVHSFRAGALPPGPVPIGRPIANMRAWVLDAAGRPVADGVVGELCLGGVGLAAGYFGQPERTAERFVGDLGWSRFIRGRLEIVAIPGNHVDTLEEPTVQGTARVLAEVMDRMTSPSTIAHVRPERGKLDGVRLDH